MFQGVTYYQHHKNRIKHIQKEQNPNNVNKNCSKPKQSIEIGSQIQEDEFIMVNSLMNNNYGIYHGDYFGILKLIYNQLKITVNQ